MKKQLEQIEQIEQISMKIRKKETEINELKTKQKELKIKILTSAMEENKLDINEVVEILNEYGSGNTAETDLPNLTAQDLVRE